MDTLIIGIDTGNRCIKTEHHSFIAGLKEVEKNTPFQYELLSYNGKNYMLSQNRVSYLQDKTVSDEYFVLSLYAIAKELTTRHIQIDTGIIPLSLGVGLPPSHMSLYKDKFKKYFDRGVVTFEYNGTPVTIEIKEVYVFSQGYAAIYMDYDQISKYDKSYIIDIGGYTTDIIALNNGLIDPDFYESLEFGLIHLLNKISWKINKTYGRTPAENQIDSMLETGKEILTDMPVMNIIESETTQYLNDLMRKLLEYKIDLKFSKAVFVGGGSERLKKWIKKLNYANEPYFVLNVNANAQGYEEIIRSIHSRR